MRLEGAWRRIGKGDEYKCSAWTHTWRCGLWCIEAVREPSSLCWTWSQLTAPPTPDSMHKEKELRNGERKQGRKEKKEGKRRREETREEREEGRKQGRKEKKGGIRRRKEQGRKEKKEENREEREEGRKEKKEGNKGGKRRKKETGRKEKKEERMESREEREEVVRGREERDEGSYKNQTSIYTARYRSSGLILLINCGWSLKNHEIEIARTWQAHKVVCVAAGKLTRLCV